MVKPGLGSFVEEGWAILASSWGYIYAFKLLFWGKLSPRWLQIEVKQMIYVPLPLLGCYFVSI
jgi:hypothetical protein